ncbi:bifunctional riboflavin kinase/FAD synthetase [Flavobacterium longum]|uniref:bifunctional riboflavin kinase/FAD synthetase n=1 Tax=Flavobacterium longum TaxID=1299340 RepID=UPI0039EA8AB2
MRVFNSITTFQSPKKTVVTIGTFDGVHIGHRKILSRVLRDASELDCESVVLTFFPHPRMVLQGNDGIKLLNTIAEKELLLKEAGLENLIVHPFDKDFANLSAREFVEDVLVKKLRVQKIIIGHDHRFGKNRDAGIDDLILFGEEFGFEVEQIPVHEIDDVAVSSTKIRHALNEGKMDLANDYLGYPYLLTGTVVKGRQLGRTIGFPTANLQIEESYKLIPKNGVYVAQSKIDGQTVNGMLSIGTNPTVGGKDLSIEIYYLDFNADLYGKNLLISILHFIRDEDKYDSIDLLKTAIENDKAATLAFLRK